MDLVDLTRYCASGMNKQPLRYRIVNDPEECARVFPLLKWAGFLKDWDGPAESERPVAYIVQCLDMNRAPTLSFCDDGLQLQTITLGLTTLGLGGCILKSFSATALSTALGIPEGLQPRYVLAIGYPAERVVVDDMVDNDYKYWRDKDGVHHVPKRTLDDLLIKK
jgi:nitroreductase